MRAPAKHIFLAAFLICTVSLLSACKEEAKTQQMTKVDAAGQSAPDAEEAVTEVMSEKIETNGETQTVQQEVQQVTQSAYTTETPPAFLINGNTLDPICFLSDWSQTPPEESGDGVAFYPVEGCSIGEIIVMPNEQIPGAKFVGASYTEDSFDAETDEVYSNSGYVAYRYVGNYDGNEVFIVAENGGGSGIFTTIATYEVLEMKWPENDPQAETQTFLKKVRTYAGGDRCTGGIDDAKITNEGLSYTMNATPYDILYLAGDPDRAILQSEAADQVMSCARCCYAFAHFTGDTFTGMTLNKENLPHLQPGDGDIDKSVMECFDGLIKMNLEYGDGIFDAEGTEALVREIEHVCLGRVEGEE